MMSAYVLVQLGDVSGWSDVDELHHALHAVSGVKTVHLLAGPTDIMLYVEAADQMGLVNVVAAVRGLKGVRSTDTRIVMPM
ncbi:MAG: hypothetical protein A2Z16_11130 [Chloroflexi bacterium RBG_16_54_18]|nr:MAG: hypothetical protein A2Z16_11130 [Chloroflexi bacterium RBG_16_54_18]